MEQKVVLVGKWRVMGALLAGLVIGFVLGVELIKYAPPSVTDLIYPSYIDRYTQPVKPEPPRQYQNGVPTTSNPK